MSGINGATGAPQIKVKIYNMHHSTSRESPIRSKRGLASMGRYDEADDRMSPERLRRRMARSPSPRGRYILPHREEYQLPRGLSTERSHSYKVLCVSAIHHKASDEFIKETLYREYKRFGDFSIRISHDLEEGVAYVCFRTAEDAREAKHSKPRVMLYDKVALVEPVYGSAKPEYKYLERSRTPPDYERMYHPPPPDRRHVPIDPYYAPMHPIHHHPMHPRPMHHEYMPRPPIHRGPPHMHHHPHYPPRHMIPRHAAPAPPHENKKDKFPNYLHHVSPEDDPMATRTLFAGNLEVNISDEELRRIFWKYGICEDIDIKRPPPGTGNAFAFVRFQNLDMAYRAKVELSGQYIGKFQCKVGYGKSTPATRIWVGGLGSWTSLTSLEREFDRFGAIKKIEYTKGDTCAYITYETIEAAQEAVKEMRGFALGGPERRLRIDFADLSNGQPPKPKVIGPPGYEDVPEYGLEYHAPHPHFEGYVPRGGYRGRGSYRGRGAYRGAYHYEPHRPAGGEEWRRPAPNLEYEPHRARRSVSRGPGIERSRSRSPRRRSPYSDSDSSFKRTGVLGTCRTFQEIARKCSTLWSGALILKSSLFPAKFHFTDGDPDIVDGLMKDEDGKHHLRITQRLRLDQPKLDNVQKLISTSTSHAIFLGLAGSTSSITIDDDSVQTRPLRNLVSYLKRKEAAGVISLLNKETEATGVLYAFPPCVFSTELLKKTCSSLSEDGLKEDHLVIVVVIGGTV